MGMTSSFLADCSWCFATRNWEDNRSKGPRALLIALPVKWGEFVSVVVQVGVSMTLFLYHILYIVLRPSIEVFDTPINESTEMFTLLHVWNEDEKLFHGTTKKAPHQKCPPLEKGEAAHARMRVLRELWPSHRAPSKSAFGNLVTNISTARIFFSSFGQF